MRPGLHFAHMLKSAPERQDCAGQSSFNDAYGSGSQLIVPAINFGTSSDPNFVLRFYRYTSDPNLVSIIKIDSIGTCGAIRRKITIDMNVQPSAEILKYAIAAKTRIWITGDSIIHGNIYSSWKYQDISPFNMTSDSKVEGIIGTILTNTDPDTGQKGPDLYADGDLMPYDLETLTANGKPKYTVTGETVYNSSGNPVTNVVGYSSPAFDADGNRVYDADGKGVYELADVTDVSGNPVYDSSGHPVYSVQGNKVIGYNDEIQGPCDSIGYDINYGNKAVNMPGMKITDYNTTIYHDATLPANGGGGDIPYNPSASNYTGSLSSLGTTCGTRYRNERFPQTPVATRPAAGRK